MTTEWSRTDLTLPCINELIDEAAVEAWAQASVTSIEFSVYLAGTAL